jgi:dienelactone hydrolase
MTTRDRQQLLRLYHQALARGADKRSAFLDDACRGVDDLRRDVEALLAQDPPEGFLEGPAVAAEAALPMTPPGGVLIGQRIGAYRVDARVGSGGMGEVYRATDTALGREVAIKALPPVFAFDPQRRARFEREARALAALNHPHIAHVYGLEASESSGSGAGVLVMELVEGEPLTHVLERGPLAIDDALRYGAQVADALAAAHAHGIVHRDVKPANVMVSDTGVKVLDFGLAKLLGVHRDDGESALPTGGGTTRPHEILGTVAYMSPEQAEGKSVDARSDVFSLGVLLYEMLGGRRPFGGDTALATLAATLKSTPLRLRAVRKGVPRGVERIVFRCLEKNPEARYRSAREVHQALSACAANDRRGWWRAAGVLLLVLAVAAPGLLWRRIVNERRARNELVPQLEALVERNEIDAAYTLAEEVRRYVPDDPVLARLAPQFEMTLSVKSSEPGADVSVRPYDATSDPWRSLGPTPLADVRLERRSMRWRIQKPGFETVDRITGPWASGQEISVRLHPAGTWPAGMVFVPGGTVRARNNGASLPQRDVPDFFMDTYEVTNIEYRDFVENDGYQNPEYWRDLELIDENGTSLSWEQARKRFVDTTGRFGPATWDNGNFPEGQDKHPVSGVSWYEAVAFSRYKKKQLPTIYHLTRAAVAADEATARASIAPRSNYAGKGPAPVGSFSGMGPFGTYDLAGNVREWGLNMEHGSTRRPVIGGSWGDASYIFEGVVPLPPFTRDRFTGFRLVQYSTPGNETLEEPFTPVGRDYTNIRPVSDAAFAELAAPYEYKDGSRIDAKEGRPDEAEDWTKKVVSVETGYGGERMELHMWFPKRYRPTYQPLILFSGIGAFIARGASSKNLQPGMDPMPLDFLIRSGRVLVEPVYQGSYERQRPDNSAAALNWPNGLHSHDGAVDRRRDLGRALDYLGGRDDIDISRAGYVGISTGASYALPYLALEHRFKAAVLLSGGLLQHNPPDRRIDPLPFVPWIKPPALMINGGVDPVLEMHRHQRPLFELLRRRSEPTRYCVWPDEGHAHLTKRSDVQRVILDWLDTHLGTPQPSAGVAPTDAKTRHERMSPLVKEFCSDQ